MSLTNDLLSQFVKATKDDKKTKTESTHYGTVVEYDGDTYVQLDGSELLTPVSKTTSVHDGERVTVMIKDHSATITGNVSAPSVGTTEIKEVLDEITEVEILVAGKVSTEELDAEIARIDELVADNVTIKGRLDANEATIKDIKAENVTITGDLSAVNAEVDKLKTTKLDAEVADIKYATIESLEATDIKVNNLEATYGEFKQLTTDRLDAAEATIDSLDSKYATIDILKSDYATIKQLDVEQARIDTLEAESLTADDAVIKNLQADVAEIDTLIFGSASGNVIQTSFANAVIAMLGNAQIKSAMIENVSASKITAGDIITNNVRVMSENGKLLISDETIQISDSTRVRVQIGKDASGDYSISIWDAAGNLMFSEGGITDSAIKDAIIRDDMVSETANISASKINISSLFEEINNSTKTIKATKIYLDDESQTLDVAFTNMSSELDNLDSTVSSQGTQLSVIQGQISSKVWQEDIDDAAGKLNTKYSNLEQSLNGLSATVASHTTQIAGKADESDVTAVNDRVSELSLSLDGFKTSVSSTYATKTEVDNLDDEIANTQSDVSSLTTRVSDLSLSLDGFKSSVSTTYATKTELNNLDSEVANTQSDLSKLASRMSSAETLISQNSAAIELRATKTELETVSQTATSAKNTAEAVEDNLDANYYTRTETDAAIQVESESITSTVSRTYATKQEVEDIEVGGRNLLLFTTDLPIDYNVKTGIGSWSWQGLSDTEDGLRLDAGETVDSNSFWVPLVHKGAVENNEEITLSFDYRGDLTKFGNLYFVHETNNTSCLVTDWTMEVSETEWKHFEKTFSLATANSEGCVSMLLMYGHVTTSGKGTWVEIKNRSLKLEKGNKATDWTPAPEDVENGITDVQNAANDAQTTADNAITSIVAAETTIQQLADSIAALVRDGNGGSLIRQDADGLWYFDISGIEESLSDTANDLDELTGIVLDANGEIDVLQSTAEALQARTEYIRSYTDENDQPCLELGEGDSTFKVKITNTDIQFMEGSDVPASINRKMLVIEKTMVKNELQFGDDEETGIEGVWIWKRRSNGNLGISWKGVGD